MKHVIIVIIFMSPMLLYGQYQPELDIQSGSIDHDGGEIQLGNENLTHVLRFFSGRGFDPNPFIYFANTDTFHLVSGSPDTTFNNFTPRLSIRPNGYTGINNTRPEVELQISTFDPDDGSQMELINQDKSHQLGFFSGRKNNPNSIIYWKDSAPLVFQTYNDVNGFITRFRMDDLGYHSPWNFTFRHDVPAWTYPSQIWMHQGWTGSLWDYLYLGASGNRGNHHQSALILSHQKGIQFGKGHDTGDRLSQTFMRIDSSGNVGINADPSQRLDVQGKIRVGNDATTPSGGTIRFMDSTACFEGYDGTQWLPLSGRVYDTLVISGAAFVPEDGTTTYTKGHIFGTYGQSGTANTLNAPLLLHAGDTIIQYSVFYLNDDATNTLDVGIWRSSLSHLGYLYSINTITTSFSATVTSMTDNPYVRILGDEHYMIRIRPSTGKVWNGQNLAVSGVRIVYSRKL